MEELRAPLCSAIGQPGLDRIRSTAGRCVGPLEGRWCSPHPIGGMAPARFQRDGTKGHVIPEFQVRAARSYCLATGSGRLPRVADQVAPGVCRNTSRGIRARCRWFSADDDGAPPATCDSGPPTRPCSRSSSRVQRCKLRPTSAACPSRCSEIAAFLGGLRSLCYSRGSDARRMAIHRGLSSPARQFGGLEWLWLPHTMELRPLSRDISLLGHAVSDGVARYRFL